MSTVALKGTLHYNYNAKEWSWIGVWAFGSSLEEAAATTTTSQKAPTTSSSSSHHLPLPTPTSQPFRYIWKEAAEPSQVPVPSLNVVVIGGEEEEDEEDTSASAAMDLTTTTPTKEEAASSSIPAAAAEAVDMTTEVEKTNLTDDSNNSHSAAIMEQQRSHGNSKSNTSSTTNEENQGDHPSIKMALSTATTTPSTAELMNNMEQKSSMKIVKEGQGDAAERKDPNDDQLNVTAPNCNKDSTSNTETKPDTSADTPSILDTKKEVAGLDRTSITTAPEGTTTTAVKKTPPKPDKAATNSSTTPPKPKAPLIVTFASVMEGFSDAAIHYQNKLCPKSGKWKGHFENNMTERNNREKSPKKFKTQTVEETFQLFLNATPGEGAEFSFEDESAQHIPIIPEPSSSSEFKLVQVRGCGVNQFGTFEIFGYLDLRSMVLEIQRQYVVTERRVWSRRRSSSTSRVARQYSTRKRQPSWKRKLSDTTEEDTTHGRRKRSKSEEATSSIRSVNTPAKKRDAPITVEQVMNTIANLSSAGSGGGQPNPDVVSSSRTAQSSLISAAKTVQGTSSSGLKISLPTTTTITAQSVPAPKSRRSSSGGASRRHSSSKVTSTGSVSSTGSNAGTSSHIRLPAAGDPKKARWRAAHFLYYQRVEPTEFQQQPTDGATSKPNSPKAPPKPKYVIYEGELVDNKREGRGICLYSNSTLYEGEWKRNKEHGYGKLMTSDRRTTIYEGQWERGKMQGNGTYYYGSSDPSNPGPRYIGEFKENLRNGMGCYFLPNGSVYDGQFRDGVMNGRGLFTWPDGSVYDGEWKDGKRNGQGLLKAIDGFVYDGQWVNNAMEGRGLAIYPDGQKYEGMFSHGRREGRGTIHFTNGAVYEGRFRDDAIDGQGTMKMTKLTVVTRTKKPEDSKDEESKDGDTKEQHDFMIPISFQSDLTTIHSKAGFTAHGE